MKIANKSENLNHHKHKGKKVNLNKGSIHLSQVI